MPATDADLENDARGAAPSARWMLGAIASMALALACPADATAQEAPWYDAAPLVEHVRPEQRAGLAERVEVARLEDVPLYDLHLSIEERLRAFGLRETIYVTNDERAPWSEIVLRVFANAVGGAEGAAPPVSMVASECLDGVSCTIEQTAPSVIRVRPARPLAPGARLRIQLDLQGRTRSIEAAQTAMGAQGIASLGAMMGEGGQESGDHGMLAHGDGIGSFAHFFAVLARRRAGAWVTATSAPTRSGTCARAWSYPRACRSSRAGSRRDRSRCASAPGCRRAAR
jgi:hypothetical protein